MEGSFHDESEDFSRTLDDIMSVTDQDFSAAFDDSGITPGSVLNGEADAAIGILADTLVDHGTFDESLADPFTLPNDVSHVNKEVLVTRALLLRTCASD